MGSSPTEIAMMECANCQTPTENPRFCSRRCAAAITNREKPKRAPVDKTCISCGATYNRSRRKFCSLCRKAGWAEKTLAEVGGHNNRSRHAAVRDHAQWVARDWKKACATPGCGYTRHVHVCHQRAIEDFPRTALLAVVNAPSNLILLCPTHHWEFDNLSPQERGW